MLGKLLKTAVAIALLAVGVAHAQTITLRHGHASPAAPDADDQVAALALKQYIETESKGRIRVDIFPASQLGNPAEMIEQVNAGTLHSVNTAASAIATYVPQFSIVEMPYVIRDDAVAEKFMAGPIVNFLREETKKKLPNVRLENLMNTGNWRSFYTSKPVRSVDDLKGMKIRTVPAPLLLEFLKSLGAAPVPLPWGEVYPALSSGVVAGLNNAATDIISAKLNEVVKFGILDRHSYLFGANWVSQKFLDGLPADLREVVVKGFAHSAAVQTKFNVESETAAQNRFKAAGGTITVPTPEVLAGFRAVRQKTQDWYRATYGPAWLDAFMNALAAAER